MSTLGREPARRAINAADIPDNSINASKIIDGTISAADVSSDLVTLTGSQTLTNKTLTDPIGTGGLKSIQVFTSSGTWTKPAGITTIKVYVTGGGGGGGSHNSDDAQGGGGAGGTSIKIIDVSSVSTVAVTIGGGGTATSGNDPDGGSSGGTSSFGSYCTGVGGVHVPTWGKGGRGGTSTGGDINLFGSDGHTGNIDGQSNEESGGNGGDSYWGGAGTGGTHWGVREAPQGWGCGGSGSHYSTNNAGTDGKSGVVIVEEMR